MAKQPWQFGALHGTYEIVDKGLFRDKGRLNAVSGELGRLNQQLAEKLQGEVAQALRQGLKRKGVSTGELERVLKDRGNIQFGYTGFAVGVIKFLDDNGPQWKGRSARVWLQIDQGTTVHSDRHQKMVGLWASAIGMTGRSYEPGNFTSQRTLLSEVTSFDPNEGQQGFRPFAPAAARMALRMARRGASGEDLGSFVGYITNPIRPERYFERGWQAFGGMAYVKNEYEALFRRLGIPVKWVNGTLYRR